MRVRRVKKIPPLTNININRRNIPQPQPQKKKNYHSLA